MAWVTSSHRFSFAKRFCLPSLWLLLQVKLSLCSLCVLGNFGGCYCFFFPPERNRTNLFSMIGASQIFLLDDGFVGRSKKLWSFHKNLWPFCEIISYMQSTDWLKTFWYTSDENHSRAKWSGNYSSQPQKTEIDHFFQPQTKFATGHYLAGSWFLSPWIHNRWYNLMLSGGSEGVRG